MNATINELGREPSEALDIKEARKALAERARELLKEAKRRHPEARLHRFGDHARITLGASYHSTIYSALSLSTH